MMTLFVGNLQVPTAWELLPSMPTSLGYFGIVPFQNSAEPEYAEYLTQLNAYGPSQSLHIPLGNPMTSISNYGSEAVDAVVTMAKALDAVPVADRRNGPLVKAAIQATNFAGVSGNVQFTPEGDRAAPKFTVLNLGRKFGGEWSWTNVGSVGAVPGSLALGSLCWSDALGGCSADGPPTDQFPIPEPVIPEPVSSSWNCL